ncbi:MAG: glycosyl hydrolase family 28-related protein [Defluviicoccus sp.]
MPQVIQKNVKASGAYLAEALVTGAGTTAARSLGDRFAELHNVKDFGAVGDGVTDDTAAIQAALNAGPTLDQSGPPIRGHRVHFPPGRYLISAPLIVRSQATRLIGAGADVTTLAAAATFAADSGARALGKWLVIAEDSYLKGPIVENLYGFALSGFCFDMQWASDIRGLWGGGLRNGSVIADIAVRRTGLTAVQLDWGAANAHAICQGVTVRNIAEINWNVGDVQPRTEPMVWLAAANECLVADVNSSSVNTYHNTGSAVQVGSATYHCSHNSLRGCGGGYFRGTEVTVESTAAFQIDELVDVTLDAGRVFTFQLKSKAGNVLKGLSGDADGVGSNYIPEVGKNAVGRTSGASSAIWAATWGTAIRIHNARYTDVELSFSELNACGVTLDYTNPAECVGTRIGPINDFSYTSSCAVAILRASYVTIESAIAQERIYIGASAYSVRIYGNDRVGYPMNVVARAEAVVCDTGMERNGVKGFALQGGSSGNFSLFLGGVAGDEPAAEWQTTGSYGIMRMRNGTPLKLYGGTVETPVPLLNIGEDGKLTVYTSTGAAAVLQSTNDNKLGFFGAIPAAKPSISGGTDSEKITSIIAALSALGLATTE